jgi:hypothetical protein
MTGKPFKYMVLYYNTPDSHYGYNEEMHFKKINEFCKALGLLISPIDIMIKKSKQTKYSFVFSDNLSNRNKAQSIAESFLFSMSLIVGPNNVRVGGPLIFNIPLDILKDDRKLDHLEFLSMEEDFETADEPVIEVPEFSRGFSQNSTIEDHELAWKLSPFVFYDRSLFLALAYMESSQEYFFVYPGQIAGVLSNPLSVPFTTLEKIKFEHALEDAYKAVEAVIGEPPSDNAKLCIKLENIGVDPHRIMRTDPKEELFESIKKLKRVRGRKAAHTNTNIDRKIQEEELMNYQIIARTVVICAIEAKCGFSL